MVELLRQPELLPYEQDTGQCSQVKIPRKFTIQGGVGVLSDQLVVKVAEDGLLKTIRNQFI